MASYSSRSDSPGSLHSFRNFANPSLLCLQDPNDALRDFAKDRSTAILLGAGVSKSFGYPLTSELLPNIAKKIARSLAGHSGPAFDRAKKLEDALQVLQPPWRDSTIEQPLITDILSLLDYGHVVGHVEIPGLRPEECTEVRLLLECALVEAIDEVFDEGPFSEDCSRFVDWTMTVATGVISTNYDIEYDMALFERLSKARIVAELDFGFSWRDPAGNWLHERPPQPAFRLYKLHGSVNWLRCPLCEHSYINVYGSIRKLAYVSLKGDATTCDCGQYPMSPVTVSPSYLRDIRNPDLLYLWKNALELLRNADHWVIAGYSLPPEDIAIRSMLHRAYRASLLSGRKPTVDIVLKTATKDAVGRYKSLFPDATIHGGGIGAYIGSVYP